MSKVTSSGAGPGVSLFAEPEGYQRSSVRTQWYSTGRQLSLQDARGFLTSAQWVLTLWDHVLDQGVSTNEEQRHICRPSLRRKVTLTYLRTYGAEPFLRSCQLCSHSENSQQYKGTRRFITVFTRALHWSLSWVSPIQSLPSHPISPRSILILSTHLPLGLATIKLLRRT
jgi:hypothetical protein